MEAVQLRQTETCDAASSEVAVQETRERGTARGESGRNGHRFRRWSERSTADRRRRGGDSGAWEARDGREAEGRARRRMCCWLRPLLWSSQPTLFLGCFFSAGLRIWKLHIRVSSTLIIAPALSNSPH